MNPATAFLLHLESFYNRVGADSRIGPAHISLYLALFHLWWQGHLKAPFAVSQCQLMKMAKIRRKLPFINI